MAVSDAAYTGGALWKRALEHSRASAAFDCLPEAASDESMVVNGKVLNACLRRAYDVF
jgi:hypothetical protein